METQVLLVWTALGLIGVWIVNNLYRHFTFWQSQGIPAPPYIGFAWFRGPFFQFIYDHSTKLGHPKIMGHYLSHTKKLLILNDAKMVRDFSTKQSHQFRIRNSLLTYDSSNIVKSLFLIEANEDWKRIRSVISPAFTSGKLKQMISPIEKIATNFVTHLRPMAKSGQLFDLKQFISGFSMDVIAKCGYGIELDSLSVPNHPIVVNARKILNIDASLGRIFRVLFPSIASKMGINFFDAEAVGYFDKLTFDIVERRQQNTGKQNHDFLGLMIEESQVSTNPHSRGLKGLSNDEMSGQGIVFFIAGYDTTHATFDHALYYLAQYPNWQERLFQELDLVRDELNYEKFKHLPILNALINETLRLNPPLTVVNREAAEDCQLLDTGINVPKNTSISFEPYVIHRNPEYFEDPLSFKPERFLDNPNLESHFAFMPFGAGPRLCIGMRFAQTELRIGLAKFVLNYRITMDPDFKLEYFSGSILMSPKKLMARLSER